MYEYIWYDSTFKLCKQLERLSLEKKAKFAGLKLLDELGENNVNIPTENYIIPTSQQLTMYNHDKLYEELPTCNNCFKYLFSPSYQRMESLAAKH